LPASRAAVVPAADVGRGGGCVPWKNRRTSGSSCGVPLLSAIFTAFPVDRQKAMVRLKPSSAPSRQASAGLRAASRATLIPAAFGASCELHLSGGSVCAPVRYRIRS
jgi:hypothetical protein